MSLISLFPDLQEISRSLRQYNSPFVFRYSKTTLQMRATVSASGNWGYTLLAWLALEGAFCLFAIYQGNYIILGVALLFGLVTAWREYSAHKFGPDIKVIRLQNEVVVDTVTQQITVEHLHPYFRQHIAESTVVSFTEVLDVVACQGKTQSEGEDFGQVYLLLTDDTQLYLAEVDTQRIAHRIARVLQQVLGLPVEPEPKPWWQF